MEQLTFNSDPDDIPLTELLVIRDGIATFSSQFQNGFPAETDAVIHFLSSLTLTNCAYGAANCRVYPLLIALNPDDSFSSGRDVLRIVKARNFQSEHIQSLNEQEIPYPGYHPHMRNDEVHTDPLEQYIFSHQHAVDSKVVHEQIRDFVFERRLWYVLLHMTPKQYDEFMFSKYVVLFAVGKVPDLPYAIGVVTHQVCHNLCD